ncbi:MAG TPA: carboxypeptidase-like regulatory domain-containing protein [Gemmatimonadaceae bacterium]|nr:carboxypeptidase-like regulatory domain-containing protein [Gemmatimonadaceae bacterium]
MRVDARLLIVACAGVLGLLTGAPLAAQRGIVHGVVRDTAGAPVAMAVVTVPPDRRARTDSSGRFTLTGVRPGLREIRVRRIGYAPFDATLRLAADGRDTVRAELAPSPRRVLPPIVTRAERQCARRTYDGLLCRKADGRGLVFTVDEIDEMQPEYLADLLEHVEGLRLVYGIDSIRGPARYPRAVGRCLVQLRNGLPQMAYWTPWARSTIDDIAGLELYRPRETPPEYRWYMRSDLPCWLLNVWTWDKLKG